jgi:hypothetical protein
MKLFIKTKGEMNKSVMVGEKPVTPSMSIDMINEKYDIDKLESEGEIDFGEA